MTRSLFKAEIFVVLTSRTFLKDDGARRPTLTEALGDRVSQGRMPSVSYPHPDRGPNAANHLLENADPTELFTS
jgi:hypothetical protein